MSYSKVSIDDDEEMVLYEAPSGRLASGPSDEANRSSHDGEQGSGPRDPLLASFENDEMSSVEGGKSSDERLRTDEDDDLSRHIHEAAMNAGTNSTNAETAAGSSSSQDSSSSQAVPSTTHNLLSLGYISTHFNFLDRAFNRRTTDRIMGRGTENDGVFSNMSAKPDTQPVESDKPPTYEEAAADSTPPYWENSILTPGFNDEVFVDGLPVGNIINFVWNLLVSASFQFVGFLLTYILHTSHAAKQGSRAGLGFTFITYAYYMIPTKHTLSTDTDSLAATKVEPTSPNDYDVSIQDTVDGAVDQFHSSLAASAEAADIDQGSTTHVWIFLSLVFFGGCFMIVKAFLDYHRARKMESIILAPPANAVIPPEEAV